MKNLNILKAITLFSAVILLQTFSATGVKAAECTRDATSGGILASNFSSSGVCQVTPDVAMFPLLKIGLCAEVPTYANYLTNCKFLVEYAIQKKVQISKSTTVELKDSLTLDEGIYKAAVLVVGNTIGLKHSDYFHTSINGQEANGSVFDVGPGKYCATRTATGNLDQFDSADDDTAALATDEVDTLESFLICDDVAPTAGLYVEDKGAYEHNDLCTLDSGSVVAPATLTTTNSTVGKVQICALASDGTTPAQPGVQQLAIQTLPTAVTINANTKSINLGFELTNMLQFEQHSATYSGTATVYTNAFVESVGLKITTN
ncbi:hypothetical protein N9Q71_01315 [Amylibacter sp.]|nr:hypothetical protein [Amylibacter sp.]